MKVKRLAKGRHPMKTRLLVTVLALLVIGFPPYRH